MRTLKGFTQYIRESSKEIVVGWGSMNPPSIDHGKYIDAVQRISGDVPHRIYTSQSNGLLEYTTKVKYLRKMFPKSARNIMSNKAVHTPYDLMSSLYDEGYVKVTFVVSEDRVPEYNATLNKWNGKPGRHGFYNFDGGVRVVSSSTEDPDGSLRESMIRSASDNDFMSFSKKIPTGFTESKEMFNAIRTSMGLKESHDFRTHVQLKPVSDIREKYVAGELFKVGSEVIIPETDEICKVKLRGSNYVIVERIDGSKSRRWIDSIHQIEE